MMRKTTTNHFTRKPKFAPGLYAILSLGVLSALALFTQTSRAQTATIPLGSYTAAVPQDARVGNLVFPGGEYQLTLLAGGRYQLGRNNFITLSGTYTVSGNQVRFASPATPNTMDTCSGEGTYLWAVAGNRLTLTATTARVDSCVERLVGLTGAAFFKDDPANLASGTHTLVVTRGGVASNSVTIAIK